MCEQGHGTCNMADSVCIHSWPMVMTPGDLHDSWHHDQQNALGVVNILACKLLRSEPSSIQGQQAYVISSQNSLPKPDVPPFVHLLHGLLLFHSHTNELEVMPLQGLRGYVCKITVVPASSVATRILWTGDIQVCLAGFTVTHHQAAKRFQTLYNW